MKNYSRPQPSNWKGRASGQALYLHEKIRMMDLSEPAPPVTSPAFGLLGYACDEGVSRNQGRPGAEKGPGAICEILGRLPNHLAGEVTLWDTGNIHCKNGNLENAQAGLQKAVGQLLEAGLRPLLLGGGHDMAYPHFRGLETHLGPGKRIGIINFDAHFDLRDNDKGNNSGTPFFQLGKEARDAGRPFDYLCLGIRRDANDARLFETAESLGVHYIERDDFTIRELTTVQMGLMAFMDQVDGVYVSVDLDGFSSAYAPGVSAPSPMGFAPDIVVESLRTIIDSGKLQSLDIAELNPRFDRDGLTARLAAALLHEVIHRWALL